MAIQLTDHDGRIWIVLQRPADRGFMENLVVEMVSIARPVGAGQLQADKHRATSLDDAAKAAVETAKLDSYSFHYPGFEQYVFDYVIGHRIKVRILPLGLHLEHTREVLRPYQGRPLLEATAFDEMYGKGMLLNAVHLALGVSREKLEGHL